MKNKQKNFDSKVSKKVIYASSALLAATAFVTVTSSDIGQNMQGVNPVVQAATDLQVARLDGLVTNTRNISFYVPGAQNHTISSIGVKSPKTGNWLSWGASSVKVSSDKKHFDVTFTNSDNLNFINNSENVGKSMAFELKFDGDNGIKIPYSKAIDSSELMNAKKQGKSSIDALVNLTAQQSEDYKTQIENSQNTTQVNTIVNQSQATNDLATLNQYKKQKQSELKQKGKEIIDWIMSWFRRNPMTLLNPKELARQTSLINQINSSLNKAQTDINNANSMGEVDRIVNNATTQFNQTKDITDTANADALKKSAQNQAKKELQTKYDSLNEQLNMMSDLTDKSSLQTELTNAFNSGNAAIEGASSADDANSKKSTAISNLEAVLAKAKNDQKSNQDNRLATSRNQAKADLDNQYQQLQAKLNSLPDSSPKKSGLTQRVTDFYSQSNQDSLTQAPDEGGLAQAKTNLIQTFNTLANDLDTAKLQQEITDLITTKSTDVTNAVEEMGNITDKSNILSSITGTKNNLINNIPNTLSDLAIYKEKVSHAFDQIKADAGLLNQSNLDQAKNDAKRAINQKTDEVQAIIGELANPQKAQLQSELNAKSKAGRDNVDGVSKSADALLAKDNSLIDLESLKQKANQAKAGQQAANNNQQLAQSAQDYIQALQPLSDDKKLGFNKQVNDLVTSYQTKLAADNSDVNALSTSFVQKLEEIKSAANLANQKQVLDSQITQKSADAQKVIDNSYNLDSDQRAKLTQDLAKKTSDLRQSISGAQNPADLDIKKSEIGQLDDFAKDTKLANDKAKASHDLKTKAQEVKNNLDKLPGLTKEQIKSAQKLIDDKLNDGLADLSKPETTDVNGKKQSIASTLDAILSQKTQSSNQVLTDKRTNLESQLENKRSELETKIKALSHLDSSQINSGIDKVSDLKSKAVTDLVPIESINQLEQVANLALANMEDEYNQLKLADDKAKASATLSENIDSENGRIDNLTGLSSDEQQAAKAELKTIKDQLPTAFDGLDSDNAIAQKQLEVQNQINQVYNEYNQKSNANLENAKSSAKSRLKEQYDDLLNKIDNHTDFNALTAEEKQNYIEQVNDAFNETAQDNAKIDKSDSTQAIGYLEQATKAKLTDLSNQVKLANLKKQKAAELLEQAKLENLQRNQQTSVDQSNGDIKSDYSLSGLTEEAKRQLQDELNNLASTTVDLTNAKSEQEVLSAFNQQLAAINQRFDEAANTSQKNIENAKSSAKSELKSPILDGLNLTETQRQEFDNQINQKLSDGEANINNSKEFETISQYKNSANQGMQATLEQAQLQSDKNTAITKANQHRDNQKRAIDQMLGLSDSDKNGLKGQIDNSINALVADNSESVSGVNSSEQITSLVADNNAAIEKIMDDAKKQNRDKINDVRAKAKLQLENEIESNTLPQLKNSNLSQSYQDEIDQIQFDMENSIKDNDNPSDIAYQLAQAKLKVADVKRRADLDQKRENARQQLLGYAQKLTGQLDNLQPVDQTDKDNAKNLINLISDEADFGSANSQAEIIQVLSQKQKDMVDHYQSVEDIKQTNLESERTDRFEKLAEQVDNLQNEIINQPNLTPEQQEQYINQLYTSLFNANDDLQQALSFKDMNDIENTMNKVAQDVIKNAKLTNNNQQPTPTPTPVPTDDNNDSPQPTNQKLTASEVSQEVGQAVKQAQDTINQNTTLTPQQKQNYLNALTNLQTESNNQLNQLGFDPSTFNMPNLNQNVQAILTSFNDFVKSQPTNPNNTTPNNQSTNTNITANTQNTGNNTIANNRNGNPTQNAGTTRTDSGNSYRYYPATTAQTGGSQGQLEPANSGQTQNGNSNRDTGGLIQRSNQGNNRSSVANGGSNGSVDKVANLNKDNDSGQSNNWWNAVPYIGALIVAIGGIFWLIAKRRKDDDEE
ncbi:hypothetical protein R4Y45_00845 [Holzapfeliella sp. He02]|uniref:Protein G-related albumin-binding (GA) module domain-containing protein n=1 Tax=Holzapfeliella saturejae TaxID=3082953 RepID=A0ABU8SES8_9LACO